MKPVFFLSLLAFGFAAAARSETPPTATRVAAPKATPLTYVDIVKIRDGQGAEGKLGPILRIVSPLADASVMPGDGRLGAGSFNGSGFALNLEIVTRDTVPVQAKEGLNIRDTTLLGQLNPNFPGLYVFFDVDLIKPDGGTIAKNVNLASLFNIAGSDDTPGPGITIWAGWHVLESLPADVNTFRITAAIVDEAGRIGYDQVTLRVSRGAGQPTSGQALTPAPVAVTPTGIDDPNGPDVVMIAPRVPTRVATGPTVGNPAPPASGSLHFIQVTARDRSRAGIGVNENGDGKPDADRGTIVDGSQIQNPTVHPANGFNRNYPGLNVTFDVPLRQPNGNLVPAGSNLAPIFNIVGSELDADGLVVTTADWVVGGSLVLPSGKNFMTISATVTDNSNKSRTTRQIVGISPIQNGQDLTTSSSIDLDLSSSASAQRLVNVSTRGTAGTGDDAMIAGFVITGNSQKRVLIRAAGPALAQFGVRTALARPQLTLFSGSTVVATNTGWSTSPDVAAIREAAAGVGAFAFGATSVDSALLVNLAPGAYTAQVVGVGGTTGVALLEVYEVP